MSDYDGSLWSIVQTLISSVSRTFVAEACGVGAFVRRVTFITARLLTLSVLDLAYSLCFLVSTLVRSLLAKLL